jgi:hypothetical protein
VLRPVSTTVEFSCRERSVALTYRASEIGLPTPMNKRDVPASSQLLTKRDLSIDDYTSFENGTSDAPLS